MAILATFGLKQSNGQWKNYTIEIKDQTDQYGQNVWIYESQTKEQKDAKEKRITFANGKKVWDNGQMPPNGLKKESVASNGSNNTNDDLPF